MAAMRDVEIDHPFSPVMFKEGMYFEENEEDSQDTPFAEIHELLNLIWNAKLSYEPASYFILKEYKEIIRFYTGQDYVKAQCYVLYEILSKMTNVMDASAICNVITNVVPLHPDEITGELFEKVVTGVKTDLNHPNSLFGSDEGKFYDAFKEANDEWQWTFDEFCDMYDDYEDYLRQAQQHGCDLRSYHSALYGYCHSGSSSAKKDCYRAFSKCTGEVLDYDSDSQNAAIDAYITRPDPCDPYHPANIGSGRKRGLF